MTTETIQKAWDDFAAARHDMRVRLAAEAMHVTLDAINAAHPPRKGPAEIFTRLLAAGQPVAFIVECGA